MLGSNNIDVVIYFYIFICATLLVYNVLYILRSKGKTRRRQRLEKWWMEELQEQWRRFEQGEHITKSHTDKVRGKLKRIEQLMAYHAAVTIGLEEKKEIVQRYLDDIHLLFQELAIVYGKRSAMERAYYAHIMAIYHPGRELRSGQLTNIMLRYFDDSTIFCRENVLQALYAMGRIGAVESAFSVINDRNWYHNSRLLSDGLTTFAGNKQELAGRLWRRCRDWNENLQVAVVQFATGVSGSFVTEFITPLRSESTPLETRFALLRYFQRWVYPPAKDILLDLLATGENSGLAITAAAVLGRYPGEDTRDMLLDALKSRHWHIRRNAASSLAALGSSEADIQHLKDQGDRYGAEMLEYVLLSREKGNTAPTKAAQAKVTTGVVD